MRAARSSCCPASSSPSSARACPAESTPAATRRCTGSGQLSSRIVLVTDRAAAADAVGELLVGDAELVEQLLVGRRLLERVELDAVDVLQQRVAQHRVVGGLADDRRDRVQAGPLARPPAALAHDELVRCRGRASRTTIGCSRPNSRIECASSASASSSNSVRGCCGLGRIALTGISRQLGEPGGAADRRRRRAPSAGRSLSSEALVPIADGRRRAVGPVGISAASPRPRPPLRCGTIARHRGYRLGPRRATAPAVGDLPRRVEVAHRPARARVVGEHRLAVARRLGDLHAARDHGAQHRVAEVAADLVGDLVGELRAAVVHGQQDRRDVQVGVEVRPHEVDVRQQLPEPLERVVLALDRDQHLVRRDQRVDGEQAERGRAVDEDVVDVELVERLRHQRLLEPRARGPPC